MRSIALEVRAGRPTQRSSGTPPSRMGSPPHPGKPLPAASKPLQANAIRALPRRANTAVAYPDPEVVTTTSRENAAEALRALLSGGSGVLVASTAITELSRTGVRGGTAERGRETLNSTRQRLERSMTIPPSSPPTRPRPSANPSPTSSTSATAAAAHRRAIAAAAAAATATTTTSRPRSHQRGRRTGTGYSSSRVNVKRRPKASPGNQAVAGDKRKQKDRKGQGVGGGGTQHMSTFLSDVGHTGLLSKQQEVQYTVAAQELMRLEAVRDAVVASVGRSLTMDEWAAAAHLPTKTLHSRVQSGEEGKRLMVEHNVRLAIHVARRYVNKGVPMGDLVQEGLTGLVRAIEKFDPALGFRFSTYAHYWVRQGITRAVSDQSRTIRLPVHVYDTLSKIRKARRELDDRSYDGPSDGTVAHYLGMPEAKVTAVLHSALPTLALDDAQFNSEFKHSGDDKQAAKVEAIEADDSDSAAPEVRCEMSLLGQDMEKALAQLAPRERNILCMRYGLASVDGSTMTLKEIGRAYGLTRERIRQILDRALRKLRHPQRSLLGDYVHTLQPVEHRYTL